MTKIEYDQSAASAGKNITSTSFVVPIIAESEKGGGK